MIDPDSLPPAERAAMEAWIGSDFGDEGVLAAVRAALAVSVDRLEWLRHAVVTAEAEVAARQAVLDAATQNLQTRQAELDAAIGQAMEVPGERPADPPATNRVVAYNMAFWRKARGLTQEQLGERLELVTGRRWSKATVSAAERSIDGKRIKQFNADEIAALSQCLDVPMSALFCRA